MYYELKRMGFELWSKMVHHYQASVSFLQPKSYAKQRQNFL